MDSVWSVAFYFVVYMVLRNTSSHFKSVYGKFLLLNHFRTIFITVHYPFFFLVFLPPANATEVEETALEEKYANRIINIFADIKWFGKNMHETRGIPSLRNFLIYTELRYIFHLLPIPWYKFEIFRIDGCRILVW